MPRTLTVGTPWRAIILFAIPLLIGNVVQQLYQVIDAIIVGQNLGVNSLAAVGSTGGIMFLVMGFAWGMTTGFAIPTAQAFGAGNKKAMRRSVAVGIILTALASVLLTIIGVFFSHSLLVLLQTPAELIEDATIFAVISFIGASATMFFNYFSAIIRAIGDSRTPLIFLAISCGANIAFVFFFVKGQGWGVGGAAAATVVAQALSVALCTIHIAKSIPDLRPQKEDWTNCGSEIGLHLRLGLPMGFQASIIAIGAIAVQIRLNLLGSEAVAAYTTATRVDGLATAFLASLGLATSTFVAQNYGANLFDRIKTGTRQSGYIAVIASVVLAAVLIGLGEPIIRMFVGSGNPEVVAMAHRFLVINGILYWVLAILFVTRGALQGLGNVLIPTLSGIIELGLRIWAAVMLGDSYGFTGVAAANPLAWIAATMLLVPAWMVAKRSFNRRSVQRETTYCHADASV